MRLGITMFATDRTMPPHELAVAAEERGFASLYLPEHTHIPVARTTPSPYGTDALPDDYARIPDPLVALAAAAVLTSTITLGTGVLLAAQRDPVVTAKAVATLDRISGGRVVLGIGYGWNREEAADHGVDWTTRRARVRENLLAMRELWTKEEAAFKGEYASFEPSWSWPKPAARVPVLLGGTPGPTLFAQVAEYGDGWMPIGGAGVREALPALRAACEAAGRPMARVVPFGTVPTPGKLEYFAGLGVEEVVLRVPGGGQDAVLPVLDRYAASYLRG
ncbi:TIGR03619 family F420-dependent LLM class oxidoreductase [Actinomadura oligospora]|uniref:TIGR03619 family F420-dependent LLM class oxidoreductase n=1 Tax=Actinomadura oligospora TaxID=111804 RepID=UPI00047AEE81|nr:TIGR03619 family F420-dependent LLM class oxidoreductase [Actinomadura oligospora]